MKKLLLITLLLALFSWCGVSQEKYDQLQKEVDGLKSDKIDETRAQEDKELKVLEAKERMQNKQRIKDLRYKYEKECKASSESNSEAFKRVHIDNCMKELWVYEFDNNVWNCWMKKSWKDINESALYWFKYVENCINKKLVPYQ